MTDRTQSQRERAAAIRRHTDGADAPGADSQALHPLLSLQRQVGNAQIARMIAQRAAPEEELQATHDAAQRAAPEEDELQGMHDTAQRAAPEEDELQGMHDTAQRHGDHDDSLQAAPEVGLEGGPVSDGLAQRIDSARGGGAPLGDSTRGAMESAFGTSFDGVRVHSDAESDSLNRSISAKAFTTGNDIFLRGDSSASDQSLMAHELTHVVQQRSMSGGGQMSVGPAGDSYEQEADQTAAAVTAGQPAPQRKTSAEG